ncbi:MAG TPA: hypothetical protein PKE57_03745, partial [Cellvibrionaceae bacterium]|nr:hypothetical protein [Cellvibrionaceae bacterium]
GGAIARLMPRAVSSSSAHLLVGGADFYRHEAAGLCRTSGKPLQLPPFAVIGRPHAYVHARAQIPVRK